MKKKSKTLSPIQIARLSSAAPTHAVQEPSGSHGGKLKPLGVRGKRQNKWYEREKALHFIKYPYCALCLLDGIRNDGDRTLHHKAGRKGSLLWERKHFLTTCMHHHRYIHDNTKEALAEGWLVRLPKAEVDALNTEYRNLGMF